MLMVFYFFLHTIESKLYRALLSNKYPVIYKKIDKLLPRFRDVGESILWNPLRDTEFNLVGLDSCFEYFSTDFSSNSENAERKRVFGTRF